MYGFGDVVNPLPESVDIVEELVFDYIHHMVCLFLALKCVCACACFPFVVKREYVCTIIISLYRIRPLTLKREYVCRQNYALYCVSGCRFILFTHFSIYVPHF